jgi:hypothetical protein
MTVPNSQDTDYSIPKVEVDIDLDPSELPSLSSKLTLIFQQFQAWYERLAAPAKIGVAIALFFIAVTLLLKVLHLIASLITVTILAIVLYGIYRAFLKPNLS